MDLMFHAPYVLRGALLFLVAGLPLAIWPAARRRDWQKVRRLAQLLVGLMLVAGGGAALTGTVSDARAAGMAVVGGAALMTAGAAAVTWATFGLRAGGRQRGRES